MHPTNLPQGLLPILDEAYARQIASVEIIEAFLDAQVQPFIVSSRNMSMSQYAEYIHAISLLKDEMDFEFIIHEHAHTVPVSGACGLHLTSKSLPFAEAKTYLNSQHLIGYSAHSLDDALMAENHGAHYIILGAIFPTPKENPDHPVLGITELKKICRRVSLPVYAIGGINAENLMQIKDAGAAGFCAMRAVYDNDQIEHNITKLNIMWEEWD